MSRRIPPWSVSVALWGCWLFGTGLGAYAIRGPAVPASATLRALIGCATVVYAGVVSVGWLHLSRLQALALSVAAVLGLGWMAGVTAQGWILLHAWGLVLVAALSWRVSQRERARRQILQLAAERLEETRQQNAAELQHLQQTLDGVKRRLQRYRRLQEVAQHLSRSLDLPSVARILVTQTFHMIGKSSACLLFLLDRSTQSLALTASHRAADVPPILTKRGDVLDSTVLRTRRGLVVDDVLRDARFVPDDVRGRAMHACVATPLMVDQRVDGVLRLESPEVGVYLQEDLRLLDLLAELGTTAMATARLYAQTQELAMTDGLTGLLVRRALLEGLRKELLRAERRGETRALLMVDIDLFKRYNDALGHAAGDLVLKGVARILKEQAGHDGLVARYGGEEFTVLLNQGTPTRAIERTERIRQAVAAESFVLRRETSHVTISIGVAQYPADGREPLELLRAADDRLYRAKQTGRNRVCVS